MIGPNVIQAIIDNTGDNWKGFPFLFAMCAAASIVIWFGTSSIDLAFRVRVVLRVGSLGVDVNTGRRDAAAWAEKNRQYAQTGVLKDDDSVDSKDFARKD